MPFTAVRLVESIASGTTGAGDEEEEEELIVGDGIIKLPLESRGVKGFTARTDTV